MHPQSIYDMLLGAWVIAFKFKKKKKLRSIDVVLGGGVGTIFTTTLLAYSERTMLF